MRDIETDYLVVGGGASAMAFVDALTGAADVEVVIVDRRHRPGGHWLDAYPFVRLHQPSANYGVSSRQLGADRIDDFGPNAGCYERATAQEICDYFNRVLDEQFLPSGKVRFLGMSDYRGVDTDGHHVVSLLTGEQTVVRVRQKLVDATLIAPSIPARHTPPYVAGSDVRVIPPNALVDLTAAPRGFTVLGAGKTAMDTCNWLLDHGVEPDRIRWVRPRDAWLLNRAYMQPLELVGSYMQLQANWLDAAAHATDGTDFGRRLEESESLLRIDPSVEPEAFRGAILSTDELAALRMIERVVRERRVLAVEASRLVTDHGDIASEPGEVYVDCTAAGVPALAPRPVFQPGRILLQYVTVGFVPWGAAIIGAVEALSDDDLAVKNKMCPVGTWTGNIADVLSLALSTITGSLARGADPEFARWNDSSRLNPARDAAKHMDNPVTAKAYAAIRKNIGPALENLHRRTTPLATTG